MASKERVSVASRLTRCYQGDSAEGRGRGRGHGRACRMRYVEFTNSRD